MAVNWHYVGLGIDSMLDLLHTLIGIYTLGLNEERLREIAAAIQLSNHCVCVVVSLMYATDNSIRTEYHLMVTRDNPYGTHLVLCCSIITLIFIATQQL